MGIALALDSGFGKRQSFVTERAGHLSKIAPFILVMDDRTTFSCLTQNNGDIFFVAIEPIFLHEIKTVTNIAFLSRKIRQRAPPQIPDWR